MKKCPFILIEVLIAISLLSLCALPLISEPLFAHKKMREKYFELELEREAEKIYYEVLQKDLSLQQITRKQTKTPLGPLTISIDGLGKKTYKNTHYHLYHCINVEEHTSPYYMIHLGVCFEKCQPSKYKFQFVGKIVDQKESDLHVENHEGLSSDIQAIRQSE